MEFTPSKKVTRFRSLGLKTAGSNRTRHCSACLGPVKYDKGLSGQKHVRINSIFPTSGFSRDLQKLMNVSTALTASLPNSPQSSVNYRHPASQQAERSTVATVERLYRSRVKSDPIQVNAPPVEAKYPYLFKQARLKSAIPRFTRPEMVTYVPPSGKKSCLYIL